MLLLRGLCTPPFRVTEGKRCSLTMDAAHFERHRKPASLPILHGMNCVCRTSAAPGQTQSDLSRRRRCPPSIVHMRPCFSEAREHRSRVSYTHCHVPCAYQGAACATVYVCRRGLVNQQQHSLVRAQSECPMPESPTQLPAGSRQQPRTPTRPVLPTLNQIQ